MSLSLKELQSARIIIRGAGIIGLSIAWSLIQRGLRPVIVDPSPVRQRASWAAAGMLSAQFEALIEPEVSLQLKVIAERSATLWKEFASSLERESKIAVRYWSGPTIGLLTAAQLDYFRDLNRLEAINAAPDRRELEQFAPGLNSGRRSAILFPRDGQVENRAALAALLKICEPHIVRQVDNVEENADLLIDCMGWQSDGVRPVKGQMLALRPHSSHPRVPVRWGASYIVPKTDRTIIGATVEPDDTSFEVSNSVRDNLLAAACDLFPELGTVDDIIEVWSGMRPMARRQRPIIGWLQQDQHYIASGHYRNGILLAPVTAKIFLNDLLGEDEDFDVDVSDLRPDKR